MHTTAKQVISRDVERARVSSKCQKVKNARANWAKILFFIVKYVNLWGFCCRPHRALLKLPIDLFSLYVLFSHFRARDTTRGNSFFQMSSYARANVRITNAENKRQIPMRASRGLK